MSDLLVLRHGPTAWNARGAIQGRADPPLSAAGREQVGHWRLPPDFVESLRFSSPLQRAMETAHLLGGTPLPAPPLIEMDWGDWQGRLLPELRADPTADMAAREARGLDFQPPGGESYRMVQQRLAPFLEERHADGRPAVAVCHKGVMLALYALATGWAMTGPPPDKLRDESCHLFGLHRGGRPDAVRLNIPLVQ